MNCPYCGASTDQLNSIKVCNERFCFKCGDSALAEWLLYRKVERAAVELVSNSEPLRKNDDTPHEYTLVQTSDVVRLNEALSEVMKGRNE